MSDTPELYRAIADKIADDSPGSLSHVLRAYADALDRISAVTAEHDRLSTRCKAQRINIDELQRELAAVTEERDSAQIAAKIGAQDSDSWRERATKAEAECERLRPDAERYRWLQSEAKQVYMHPNAEIDNRMRWEFPVLIALTCINSEVSLNAAIDAARRK